MPARLRLVWSAPTPSERCRKPLDLRAPSPAETEARALVDGWVNTPFESSIAALDDLVLQIAQALARRSACLVVTACPVPVQDIPDDG